MLIALLKIIGGLVLLVHGADQFVTGASQTARKLGVPPLIIGLTVVGVSTSLPEVLVGVVAALNGKTNIAIGNALGSNIANIGLVLGGTTVVIPLVVSSRTLRREFLIMCTAMLIALALMLDDYLGRWDGIILLLSLAASLAWIVTMARRSPRTDPLAREYAREYRAGAALWPSLLRILFGLVVLLAGAQILVDGAVFVARSFGISDLVIGLTIIAVGTSLPELAASIASAVKREPDIAIGNVIGSNMFNMLMVLGVPALIHPSGFGAEVVWRDFTVMLALTAIMGVVVFVYDHGRFRRSEGALLLAGFIAYQTWLFLAATS
jgi:cation:H+ antiporter